MLKQGCFSFFFSVVVVLRVWSNETTCVNPQWSSFFFSAVLLAFGENFYLDSVLPTPSASKDPTRTHTCTHVHTAAWPAVTGFVITCDVACSCYCMFSTLHMCAQICAWKCVRVDVCVHAGAICPGIQKAKATEPEQSPTVHCSQRSCHLHKHAVTEENKIPPNEVCRFLKKKGKLGGGFSACMCDPVWVF